MTCLATPDTAELLVMFNSAAAIAQAEWQEEMDKKENPALWEAREGFHEHVEVLEWCGALVLVRRLTGEEKWVDAAAVELLD